MQADRTKSSGRGSKSKVAKENTGTNGTMIGESVKGACPGNMTGVNGEANIIAATAGFRDHVRAIVAIEIGGNDQGSNHQIGDNICHHEGSAVRALHGGNAKGVNWTATARQRRRRHRPVGEKVENDVTDTENEGGVVVRMIGLATIGGGDHWDVSKFSLYEPISEAFIRTRHNRQCDCVKFLRSRVCDQ